jgi:hypothetical protein
MSNKNDNNEKSTSIKPQRFSWKQKSRHKTYESADEKRKKLIEEGEKYVKVRRCGPAGTQFKVVIGAPLEKKNTKSKKKKD